MREACADSLRFAELRAKNVERCERFYHPFEEWSLQDWLMAVTGELGELANVLKHARRGQNTGPIATDGVLDVVALGNEAADVVIYLDLLCARAGVDLGAAVRWKFNSVSRKRLGCDLVLEEEELASTRAESVRLWHALEHIAAGNISPSIDFARAVLAGATVEEAHAAAAATQDPGGEDEARWLAELAKECEACACFGVPCASCQQGDVCTGSCERHELGEEDDDRLETDEADHA